MITGSSDVYRIKSKLTSEYLYAAGDDLAYDRQRRRVFTWTNTTTTPSTDPGFWDEKGEDYVKKTVNIKF